MKYQKISMLVDGIWLKIWMSEKGPFYDYWSLSFKHRLYVDHFSVIEYLDEYAERIEDKEGKVSLHYFPLKSE